MVMTGIKKGRVFSDTLTNPEAQTLIESNRIKAMPTLILEETLKGEKYLHVLTHGTDLLLLKHMLKIAIDQIDESLSS